jgi:hypothetical protein
MRRVLILGLITLVLMVLVTKGLYAALDEEPWHTLRWAALMGWLFFIAYLIDRSAGRNSRARSARR